MARLARLAKVARIAVAIAVALVPTLWLAVGTAAGQAQAHASAAPTLDPETDRAWRAYVAATDARVAAELASPRGFLVLDFAADAAAARARTLAGEIPLAEMQTRDAAGRLIDPPDALVSHWRGSIFLPGVTLDRLWTRLQHPNERGPFPPDVLALRVLARQPDALTLFIRMTRRKLVTVTYNTEHAVTFRRDARSPSRASSRSVATRIAEVEAAAGGDRELPPDEDHGFLWRLQAYWRYEQTAGGVIVELESLTLSRDIPTGLGMLVRPMVDRIARESMTRTLEGIRQEYGGPAS